MNLILSSSANRFARKHGIRKKLFEQSVENRKDGEPFIFLEGPPTANGKPGIHHVVARTYKHLVCRWKTMQGNFVERKGGWDTHGLPVEIEVQKRLDLMSNEAIEAFGMEEFNRECRESVWTYEAAWREMTERMAYRCDLDDPYVTLHNEYIESCWWALKQMFEKGLLYRGYKVLLIVRKQNFILQSRSRTWLQRSRGTFGLC